MEYPRTLLEELDLSEEEEEMLLEALDQIEHEDEIRGAVLDIAPAKDQVQFGASEKDKYRARARELLCQAAQKDAPPTQGRTTRDSQKRASVRDAKNPGLEALLTSSMSRGRTSLEKRRVQR